MRAATNATRLSMPRLRFDGARLLKLPAIIAILVLTSISVRSEACANPLPARSLSPLPAVLGAIS